MSRRSKAVFGGIAAAGLATALLMLRSADRVRVLPTTVLPQVTIDNFRMLCPFTHINNDDPVVKPGQPGASHPHLFFANASIDAFSTLASASAVDGSCRRRFGPAAGDTEPEPADSAGYWVPRPIFAGVACDVANPKESNCPNQGAIAWYSNPDACPNVRVAPCSDVKLPVNYTFPPDLRMIAGKASSTSPAGNPIIASDNILHNCYPAKGKTIGDDDPDGLNQCADLGGNRADVWIRFPPCYVGRGGDPSWKRSPGGWVLDSPDHISHMAYPNGTGCPASHPIVLPQLVIQIPFGAINGTDMAYSSGAWYTIHFDFVNWWHEERLEALTAPAPPEAESMSPTPSPSATCTRRC